MQNSFDIPKPKDSGVRENFSTGSRRDTRKGKGRFDLLPARAIQLIAIHFENGAEKYGDRNWEKGQPLSRYLDSALRHLFKHQQGLRDEPHLIAAAWNLLCMIDTEVRIREGFLPRDLDDLEALSSNPPYDASSKIDASAGALLHPAKYPAQRAE